MKTDISADEAKITVGDFSCRKNLGQIYIVDNCLQNLSIQIQANKIFLFFYF